MYEMTMNERFNMIGLKGYLHYKTILRHKVALDV